MSIEIAQEVSSVSISNAAQKIRDEELNCNYVMSKIEKLRSEMRDMINNKGRGDMEVLEKSRQLDKLLNYYYCFCVNQEKCLRDG